MFSLFCFCRTQCYRIVPKGGLIRPCKAWGKIKSDGRNKTRLLQSEFGAICDLSPTLPIEPSGNSYPQIRPSRAVAADFSGACVVLRLVGSSRTQAPAKEFFVWHFKLRDLGGLQAISGTITTGRDKQNGRQRMALKFVTNRRPRPGQRGAGTDRPFGSFEGRPVKSLLRVDNRRWNNTDGSQCVAQAVGKAPLPNRRFQTATSGTCPLLSQRIEI